MRTAKLTTFVLAAAAFSSASGAVSAAQAGAKSAPPAAKQVAHQVIAASASPTVGTTQLGRVFSQAGRNVFRFGQSYSGYPVWQRGASVTVSDSGTLVAQRTQFAQHFGPSTPKLTKASAAQFASIAGKISFSAADATTVWLPLKTQARLVHAFYRGVVDGIPFAPLVVVDAETGAVLLRLNAVHFDRLATVHENNPEVTPEPKQVMLEALDPGATNLENATFSVQNCIDKGELSGGQFSIRKCSFEQKAIADAQGDFPQVFSAHDELEDAYAEVSMFYHLTKAYAYFETLGLKGLKSTPVSAIVNVRMPAGYSEGDFQKMQDPKLPLEPLDNAFYSPQPPFGQSVGPKGASLWFGQGLVTDFSYDGDVVAHELGHAVVDATIDFVGYFQLDKYGSWPAAGAMNEGISDYLSSAVAGDPRVGEYAAKSFVGAGAQNIRNLSNSDTCPTALAGEVHVDSTVFSGALWTVRAGLEQTDQFVFDQVIFNAMVSAPSGDIDFVDFADVIMAELKLSGLDASVAKNLEKELTDRGILPECVRVLEVGKGPVNGPSSKFAGAFVAPGFDLVPLPQGAPYVPGVMQFRRKLPLGTNRLKVLWSHRDSPYDFGGSEYNPALLVRFDDQPIEFSYGSTIESNAELVEVTRAGTYYSAEWPIGKSIEHVTVMIVNRGDTDGLYRKFSLVATTPKPPPPPGSGGFGGSLPQVPTGGNSATEGLSPGGGCMLQSRRTDGNMWWLAAALLFMRRRRRH